jgi:HAD superfamily hydrolase (TIGR01549 family)
MPEMKEKRVTAAAVVWDFDGTLVDSHPRNLAVNRRIVETITGRPYSRYPALTSISAYDAAVSRAVNWREFYAYEFGLHDADVDRAGALWPELQRDEETGLSPFEGIREALSTLADLPHAVLSQNDSLVIRPVLESVGLAGWFRLILGHGEVGSAGQKPAPDGLLRCLELLDGAPARILFYVGDHVVDARCVENARAELTASGRTDVEVVSIRAAFAAAEPDDWDVAPDHVARHPSEVARIVRSVADATGR